MGARCERLRLCGVDVLPPPAHDLEDLGVTCGVCDPPPGFGL